MLKCNILFQKKKMTFKMKCVDIWIKFFKWRIIETILYLFDSLDSISSPIFIWSLTEMNVLLAILTNFKIVHKINFELNQNKHINISNNIFQQLLRRNRRLDHLQFINGCMQFILIGTESWNLYDFIRKFARIVQWLLNWFYKCNSFALNISYIRVYSFILLFFIHFIWSSHFENKLFSLSESWKCLFICFCVVLFWLRKKHLFHFIIRTKHFKLCFHFYEWLFKLDNILWMYDLYIDAFEIFIYWKWIVFMIVRIKTVNGIMWHTYVYLNVYVCLCVNMYYYVSSMWWLWFSVCSFAQLRQICQCHFERQCVCVYFFFF